MNWIGLLVLIAVICLLMLRRGGQVSVGAAREMLKKGALVVDVRTIEEFSRGHLPEAINLPLVHFAEMLPQQIPDHDQAILLYCQTGRRSGTARKKARALGYLRSFNMGSYSRAAQIVSGR